MTAQIWTCFSPKHHQPSIRQSCMLCLEIRSCIITPPCSLRFRPRLVHNTDTVKQAHQWKCWRRTCCGHHCLAKMVESWISTTPPHPPEVLQSTQSPQSESVVEQTCRFGGKVGWSGPSPGDGVCDWLTQANDVTLLVSTEVFDLTTKTRRMSPRRLRRPQSCPRR